MCYLCIMCETKKFNVIDGHKLCRKCNELLPVDKFGKTNKIKSGYKSWCHLCENPYVKKLPSSKVVDGHKMCTKCNKLLSVDKFHLNTSVKSRLNSHCIDCCTVPKKVREPKVIIPKIKEVKPPRIVDGKCVCSTCKVLLPVDDFYVDKKRKEGLTYDCKVCKLTKNKKSRELKPKTGRYREYQKQYRKTKRDNS